MTPHRRQLNKLRKQAKKFLCQLLWEQRYRCYWCSVLIINRAAINKSRIRGLTGFKICYEIEGQQYEKALASIDHLLPLSQGGTNALDNLVAACVECNYKRNVDVEFSKPETKQVKLVPLVGHVGDIQRAAVLDLA